MRIIAFGVTEALIEHVRIRGSTVECAADPDDLAEIVALSEQTRIEDPAYTFSAAVIDCEKVGQFFPRYLRTKHKTMPIIMIGPPSISERVAFSSLRERLLNNGADDCLRAPVHVGELLASIAACLRRSENAPKIQKTFGPVIVDLARYVVTVDEIPVDLTPRELQTLVCLAEHPNITMSKERISNHIYGSSEEVDTKIVDVFICKLRAKFNKIRRGAGAQIVTGWGKGYQLSTEPQHMELEAV